MTLLVRSFVVSRDELGYLIHYSRTVAGDGRTREPINIVAEDKESRPSNTNAHLPTYNHLTPYLAFIHLCSTLAALHSVHSTCALASRTPSTLL